MGNCVNSTVNNHVFIETVNEECQDHLVENIGGLNCLYTNADSLQNKLTELQTYIDSECIDMIAITESLCKNPSADYDPVFVIEGFDCIQNNGGRGTFIVFKEKY